MKKTYEKPVLQTETFDVEDIITTSSLDERTHVFESDKTSTDTLTGYGIQIH